MGPLVGCKGISALHADRHSDEGPLWKEETPNRSYCGHSIMAVIHEIIDVLLEVGEARNAGIRLGRYVRRRHWQHLKRGEEHETK